MLCLPAATLLVCSWHANRVQNLWDDMEDLYETSNEVQDILSRSYGVPEEFDEADLEDGTSFHLVMASTIGFNADCGFWHELKFNELWQFVFVVVYRAGGAWRRS